jgi:hypothetical protein
MMGNTFWTFRENENFMNRYHGFLEIFPRKTSYNRQIQDDLKQYGQSCKFKSYDKATLWHSLFRFVVEHVPVLYIELSFRT